MKRLSYSTTSAATSPSNASSPVFCMPHYHRDPYPSCCFLFCQVHLRTAAIIIGILDIFDQFAQIYRHAELFLLLFQCNFSAATAVSFLLTFVFLVDMAVLIFLFAGIAMEKVQFIIPILFRYILSIIFDSFLILYTSISFLFSDGSLKQPLIWLYQIFHECPKNDEEYFWSLNNQNQTKTQIISISSSSEILSENNQIQNSTTEFNFNEEIFSKALDSTMFGILCISLIQLIFQIWFIRILKHYCEFLIYQTNESRRRSTEPLVIA